MAANTETDSDIEQDNDDTDDEETNDGTIKVNGTNDLICAKCFSHGTTSGAVGICKECKYYLCSECVRGHHKDPDTAHHIVAFFYCASKLRVNKLVRANYFCLDCGQYLCRKCHLDHKGFRIYRNHTFIGGLNEDESLFDHANELPCDRRNRLRPSSVETSRNCRSRLFNYSAPRTPTTKSRRKKSPGPAKPKSPYLQNRKIIFSSTGPASTQTKSCMKSPSSDRKSKSVHYKTDQKTATIVGEYNLRAPGDKQTCNITAAIYLDNNKLVVADQANTNLKLLDEDSDIDGVLQVKASKIALCECRIDPSKVYAAGDDTIYKIDTEDEFEILTTIRTEVEKIEGIEGWEKGIVVIFKALSSKSDDKGHFEIHLLDFDGEVQYQITLASQYVVRLMTPIWYTTSIDNGTQMMLADTQNNRIMCIDLLNWHINYVIKGKEKGGLPRSLTMDGDENILVVWYDEIHKLSKSGKNLGIIVKDIDRKSVITCDKSRQLLAVMSWSRTNADKFRLYKL